MKKAWAIINLIFFSVLLTACSHVENNLAIASMDTFIGGTVYAPKSKWQEIHNDLKQMYDKYHKLTDNFKGYDDVKGIYYINELVEQSGMDQTVEIEKALYDLLLLGVDLYELTDGYFDMSIGKIIDVWKEMISTAKDPGDIVSAEVIETAIKKAEAIEVIKDPVSLEQIEDKFFVTLKYGAKLDLGALAKGYVTQLAATYLKDLGYKNYLISGGGSSMLYGEGNPSTEDGSYRTGLINPQDVIDNEHILGYRPKSYGIYTSKNYNFTTSGSYNQYVLHDDTMYHHLISPKTKKPENYYLTVSIVGSDAGLNDGLSTAMFNMPPEVLEAFVLEHGYEVYTYLFTNTFKSYNESPNFRSLM